MRLLTLLVMAVGLSVVTDPSKKDDFGEIKVKDETLRQELLQRMQDDQDARKLIGALLTKHKGVDPDEIKKMDLPVVKRMNEIDHKNTDRIKQIVKQFGWPGKSLVGTDGANAAWILVQHADHDRPFQKRCLDLIEEAVKKGEATGEQFAYLTDRVRLGEKKKQLYGTQLRLVEGKAKPYPIEDEADVDKRRKEVGLSKLADYLKFSQWFLERSATGGDEAK
jgi:uncharacterized protein DUF6624